MRIHQAQLLADDFVFLEAPRWHEGKIWASDVFDRKVYSLDEKGRRAEAAVIPQRPAGLGFMPDGALIVASSLDRKLMKIVDGQVSEYADLSQHATGNVNDLAIDVEGRVYVGNFGYDFHGGEAQKPTYLHRVDADGSISVAADDVEFPNGTVIVDDGRTLIVAETFRCRLTAFDRGPDGRLSNRRVFAETGDRQPDGICADAEGAIWVSSLNTGDFFRVLEGGEVTDLISFGGSAVACELGGEDRRTLFLCMCSGTIEQTMRMERLSAVHTLRVDVPGVLPFGRI